MTSFSPLLTVGFLLSFRYGHYCWEKPKRQIAEVDQMIHESGTEVYEEFSIGKVKVCVDFVTERHMTNEEIQMEVDRRLATAGWTRDMFNQNK
jgi:hypothetical protein